MLSNLKLWLGLEISVQCQQERRMVLGRQTALVVRREHIEPMNRRECSVNAF
jgi:hypothetical protein